MRQPLGHRWQYLLVSPAACSPPAELFAPGGWTRCGLHNGQPRYCHQGPDPPSGRHSAWWCTPAPHQTGTQKSPGPLSPWPPASLPDDTSSLIQKGENALQQHLMIIRVNISLVERLLKIALLPIFASVSDCYLTILTSTESTAGKSLLQLTASPVSCFHTKPGRAKTWMIWHEKKPTVNITISTYYFVLQHQSINLRFNSERDSPGSLFLSEQLPWADQSTHTCWTLYRTGWGRNNLWLLTHPAKQADARSGLRYSRWRWNVWFWSAPVTWLDVRQKKGSGMLHSAELGHNSSDISERLSRNPPPWSMMPSAMNLHSHHWSYRAGHLQTAGLQSQLMQELFTTPASSAPGENIPPVIQSLFKLIGWLETFKHLKQGKQNALLLVWNHTNHHKTTTTRYSIDEIHSIWL